MAKRINQFHFSTAGADAVTKHLLLLREEFRKTGIEGDVFSVENKAPSEMGIKNFSPSEFAQADIALIHHSHGNPRLAEVMSVPVPKIMIYHNITPEDFFRHDTFIADLCRQGRAQLKFFENACLSLAVSHFNAEELREAHLNPVGLLPLLALPELKSEDTRATSKTRKLLFVGKVTPHKNQACLIETVSHLNHYSDHSYELVLVGRQDPVYVRYVKALAHTRGVISKVTFTGPISADELANYYRTSSAFFSASLHEGFCVPLVEAVTNHLPVFYLSTEGCNETMADAGIRILSKDPMEVAATIDTFLGHEPWLEQIKKGQEKRYRQWMTFQNSSVIQSLGKKLVALAGAPSDAERKVQAQELAEWTLEQSSSKISESI